MIRQTDRDVFNSPEGKQGELATVRHKKFIRELDFKIQQRKQVAEVLLEPKFPVVECPGCLAHRFDLPLRLCWAQQVINAAESPARRWKA